MAEQYFPFLKLPQDIRGKIFEYHFTVQVKVEPILTLSSCMPFYKAFVAPLGPQKANQQDRSFLTVPNRPQFPHSRLSLLLVCRKILQECEHIFYKLNRFSFAEGPLLATFLTDIGPRRRKFIRSIEVRSFKCRQVLSGLKLLAESEHLQQLFVIFYAATNPGLGRMKS
jgi:hypothetical protein